MKKEIMVAVVGLGLMVAGCATTPNNRFTGKGLPHERYLVGGGFEIDYAAPCDGTAYLVDMSSGRYIKTEVLDANEDFGMPDYNVEFLIDEGGLAATLDLRLYFIPDETAPAPE